MLREPDFFQSELGSFWFACFFLSGGVGRIAHNSQGRRGVKRWLAVMVCLWHSFSRPQESFLRSLDLTGEIRPSAVEVEMEEAWRGVLKRRVN